MTTIKKSYLTVTDLFCGAGGSSLGAAHAGAEVVMAANHWKLAVETHNTNFPDTDHDCADINQVDPRRYPSTDILIASPECTNHSLAKGAKRYTGQLGMFTSNQPDPAEERSRATMWDVPRFAEYHDYRVIIVENVVDAFKWVLFESWLHAMRALDYNHHIVYANSMFYGVPQSRDRMYVVFWKQGHPAPDLDYRPPAYCHKCDTWVDAVQSWKKAVRWGRYGRYGQYLYRCPTCANEVKPAHVPAYVAIDWSLTGERIGDRKRPLRPRTLERIRYGLKKYGSQPVMLPTDYSHAKNPRTRPVSRPLFTQTTRQTVALSLPFLVSTNHSNNRDRLVNDVFPTQMPHARMSLIQPPFVVRLRRTSKTQPVDAPLSTITAGGVHHGLVMPLLVSYYNTGQAHPVIDAMGTVTTHDRHALVQPVPFLTKYFNTSNPAIPITDPLGSITTIDHHALIEPKTIEVEDCYFRMLQPHEIGAAMAFPDDYVVLGGKKDRVRQYGNAVTPPVMTWIIDRCVDTLR